MKSKRLLIFVTLTFGLIVTLFWSLGSQGALAVVLPQDELASSQIQECSTTCRDGTRGYRFFFKAVTAESIQTVNSLAAELYVCPNGCAYTSIQAAVDSAAPGDTIHVAAGVYTETVTISKALSVQGSGVTGTVVNGDTAGPVFTITDNATVTITDLTIINGNLGVYNAPGSNLTLDDCLVTGNLGNGGIVNDFGSIMTLNNTVVISNYADINGGGISNIGVSLTLNNSTISSNTASLKGGGISNGVTSFSLLTLNNSVVSDNQADVGGGILNGDTGLVIISAGTVSSNTADSDGGGISSSGAMTVTNSQISGNTASRFGGGIYTSSSDTTLSRNLLSSNSASRGGGLYLHYSAAVLEQNTVTSNIATLYAGGLYLHHSPATLKENVITANATYDQAGSSGGLWLYYSDATLIGNTISFNTAILDAGGLYLQYSNATLLGNIITYNTAGFAGGGLELAHSDATFRANIITGNTAFVGGGVYLYTSDAILTNNAIIDNQSISDGSGLYVYESSPHLIHNTIANSGDGSGIYVISESDGIPSTVILTNTILSGHSVGIDVTGNNTITVNGVLWHNTPITVSPVTMATMDVQNQYIGDPVFAPDGYHITPASTAMDAGIDAGVNVDIDGHHRPYYAASDLGADEIIAISVSTDTESILVYTDTHMLTTTVRIPAGAVTETVILAYTPLETVATPGFVFAGSAFDLDVYQSGTLRFGFSFNIPVTITIHYAKADVAGLDESTLVLKYWDGSSWRDETCGSHKRRPNENWLEVPICRLGRFALFGKKYTIYLPLALRN